jgi:hypothetical protein
MTENTVIRHISCSCFPDSCLLVSSVCARTRRPLPVQRWSWEVGEEREGRGQTAARTVRMTVMVLVMLVAATRMMLVMAAGGTGGRDDDVVRWGGGVDVAVVGVALLVRPPSRENPAPNPTVGIGASGIFPGSACVP